MSLCPPKSQELSPCLKGETSPNFTGLVSEQWALENPWPPYSWDFYFFFLGAEKRPKTYINIWTFYIYKPGTSLPSCPLCMGLLCLYEATQIWHSLMHLERFIDHHNQWSIIKKCKNTAHTLLKYLCLYSSFYYNLYLHNQNIVS